MSLLALIEHHAERAARGVVYNAINNCHAKRLDSIVLHDEPGNRVRMFIAYPGHPLWRNKGDNPFSLAIHPHHCDVRLIGLYGAVENHVYALTPNVRGDFEEMDYSSGVTDGDASLTPTGARADVHRIRQSYLRYFDCVLLRGHELHTIYLPQNEEGAWLVIEGAANLGYQPRCWTNDPKPDLSELYRPIEQTTVAEIFARVAKRMRSAT